MKNLLYLVSIVFIFSCNDDNRKQPDKPKDSKYKTLLARYKDISFDTLKVFSSGSLESNQYKYKGKQLDSSDLLQLATLLGDFYVNDIDNGYFACYKFKIDSVKSGLITRTPSTYESSSIKLFIFDKQKDTITDFIELAETFGDAGDAAEKTSWLLKENQNHKAFMWYNETHDNSVDDEKDTSIQSWNYYFLMDLSKAKVDTVNANEKLLKKKFAKLLVL